MADTANWYGSAFLSAFNKEIDLNSDTIKVMAATSTYSPNLDTHNYKDDVTNEVSGANYTAGGATLANPAITYDGGTNTFKFDADDVSWGGAIPTCRYLIIYDSTPGTDATRPLLVLITLDADKTPSGVQWHANGIATVTPA